MNPLQKTPFKSSYVLFAFLAACLVLILNHESKKQGSLIHKAKVEFLDQNESAPIDEILVDEGPTQAVSVTGAKSQVKIENKTTTQDYLTEYLRRKSNESKTEYLTKAHLQVPFPEELHFVPLDLDDESIAIYGESEDVGLSMIAYPADATPQQAIQYLRDNANWIPNLEGKSISWRGVENIPPVPGSGLRESTVWSAVLSDKSELRVVFMNRQDQKGSYLSVATASSEYFWENDELFDSLYSELKALPAQNQ